MQLTDLKKSIRQLSYDEALQVVLYRRKLRTMRQPTAADVETFKEVVALLREFGSLSSCLEGL